MSMRYKLSATQDDLDLDLCLFSGQVFRWEKPAPDVWLGVDGPNWYLVRRNGDAEYEIEGNAPTEAFTSLLRLDLDMNKARAEIARLGPELAPVMEGLPGFRMMRPSSAHETLFCFLCTANNHLSRIGQMVRKLGAYGEPLAEVGGCCLTVFPSLERIAELSEEELRGAGFGYRGRSIPMVARAILQKPADWLESLRAQPYEIVHQELTRLHSIGPKLADCIALYGLGKLEAAPIDTHLWQAICRQYKPEWGAKALTDARYKEGSKLMRERFGDWTGLAHLFLYFDNQRRA